MNEKITEFLKKTTEWWQGQDRWVQVGIGAFLLGLFVGCVL